MKLRISKLHPALTDWWEVWVEDGEGNTVEMLPEPMELKQARKVAKERGLELILPESAKGDRLAPEPPCLQEGAEALDPDNDGYVRSALHSPIEQAAQEFEKRAGEEREQRKLYAEDIGMANADEATTVNAACCMGSQGAYEKAANFCRQLEKETGR